MKALFGVALISGLLTLLRIGCGFLVAKLVAVYTGPTGMAMVGQVQSLASALGGIVSAPAGAGVVRYTAQSELQGAAACAPWWTASLRWILGILAVAVPAALLFSTAIATALLDDSSYAVVVVIAALVLPLVAANALVASVLNGQQQYRLFIGLSAAAVLVSTAITVVLTALYGLPGALLAAALFGAISGIVMLVGVARQPWMRMRFWWADCERGHLAGIGKYVAMALTTAVCGPVGLILVRTILADNVGWERTGLWQAVYKVSEVYLGVLTVSLSTFFLPRLSSLRDPDAVQREVFSVARIVVPVAVGLAVGVYLLRDLVILLLFSEQFIAARDLFAIQLIGDVLKIASWLFAYPMLSTGAARWFISTEVGFSLAFVTLALLLVPEIGEKGAVMAYAVTYGAYFLVVFTNRRRFIRGSSDTAT